MKQSKTYSDRKHTEDTRIDLQLTGIMGRILYEGTGKPASNVLVKVWDDDDIVGGKRDFVNQAYTNSQGLYLVLYEAKHWDTAAHAVPAWRPDFFIEVHDTIRGRLIKLNKQSRIYKDHPIQYNLKIDQTILPKEYMNYAIPKSQDNSLNVLAYNIYMRPQHTFNNGQSTRVPHIAKQIVGVGDNYDVIVFGEAFDNSVREDLIRRLGYPYKTRTVGTVHGIYQDGGVVILSRWPIENGQGEQRLCGHICHDLEGFDCMADKGVIYARINKKGLRYHVFGTHTDSGNSSGDASTRKKQFRIIKKFIDDKIRSNKIKQNELVIIAGDLNVYKYYANSVEYHDMLRELNAVHPSLVGHRFSYDASVNDLALDEEGRQLFDYVLISKSTQAPLKSSYNQVLFFRADQGWQNYLPGKTKYKTFWDLSDHYPVFGRFELNR